MSMRSVIKTRVGEQVCVGFVIRHARGWQAFTEDSKPIGRFDQEANAVKAVYMVDAGRRLSEH